MGLLDALFQNDQGGGGLLDFLRNNAMNQPLAQTGSEGQSQYGQQPMNGMAQMQPPMFGANQPSPLDSAQWPSGPMGGPSQANAQMPVPQQPPPVIQAQSPQMQQPLAPQEPGISDRLLAGLQGFAHGGGGLLPALANGISGLATGQRADKEGMALQQQKQTQNLTQQWLMQRGVDPVAAQAAIANPEVLKSLIEQLKPKALISTGSGHLYDPNAGKDIKTYEPEQKDNFAIVQTGEDALGRKTFSKMNKATGEQTPVEGAPKSGGGLGDESKSGPEYLATLPKQIQGTVKGMLDGTIQPPSSFAAAKPYWQNMIAAAKNADPGWDENKWTSRHKMSSDIGASGNSSMGGILSNGKSSFKHLAEYTESAADLGNASHDFPLGGYLAHAQNAIGNTMGGSDTMAKIKAINDNLGHYGQESTKFYAGTGGGVEERMNALKEMTPTTTSSEEMAAYANKEKGLMLDRLREKESQIRDVMGDAYLQNHPVFTPELQKDISRIDANVAKLRGGAQTSLPGGWSVKVR